MPAKERPAPAWKRDSAGAYRSSDDRFTVVSEGSGRWFLRDNQQPDDFGQPRTTGPYATLDHAKGAADEQRSHAPETSPLVARLKDGKRSTARSAARPTSRGGKAAVAPSGEPARAPTWLERLGQKDAAAARRARALVRALDEVGIPNAEDLVRRDIEGKRPAVAEAALAAALRAAVGSALGGGLVKTARRRIPSLVAQDDDLEAFAAFVASRVVEAMLRELSVGEGAERRQRTLANWRLIEDSDQGRRLIVTPSDVFGEGRP
jgi:hypothetical protein